MFNTIQTIGCMIQVKVPHRVAVCVLLLGVIYGVWHRVAVCVLLLGIQFTQSKFQLLPPRALVLPLSQRKNQC